jgi:hypothetical protein
VVLARGAGAAQRPHARVVDMTTPQDFGGQGTGTQPGGDQPGRQFFDEVRPVVLRFIVGAIIAAALVGVVSALVGEFGDTSWRLLGTIVLFVFFALCCWYDADVSGRRSPAFGFTSVGVSLYLLVVGIQKIWLSTDDGLLRWFWLALVGRVALLHVHLLLTNKRRFTTTTMQAVTVVTIGLVALLASLLSVPFLASQGDYPELYWRVVVAVAILDLLGTVLIPLVYVLFHAATDGTTSRSQGHPGAPAAGGPYAGGPYAGPGAPAHVEPVAPAFARPPAVAHAWAEAPPAPPAPGLSPAAALPVPPASAYPALTTPFLLEWPRYVNGQPLPVAPDGTPDFTGVRGYGG